MDSGLRVFRWATVDEARELADLYLAWEKQNNEAVSQVSFIAHHILSSATSALSCFAGSPAHPAFHFGMDLLWVREVYQKGPLNAYKTYNIPISMTDHNLSEDEEFKRRQFILMSKDLGEMGFWRISDEQQFVGTLLERYRKVHQIEPFEESAAYHTFISSIIAGSGKMPADRTREAELRAVRHILHVHDMYHNAKLSETPPWWSEFRHLRLFSTDASFEVDLLLEETFNDDGKQNQEKLDKLVEKLLDVDDSAVYLDFVRYHMMDYRQDLLKDSHITSALVGVFNQLPNGSTQPPHWRFNAESSRRFYPHQCELFAVKLLETIHSGMVCRASQVKAAENLTQLPTTTIIEIAELLKENLNPRVIEAILMFLPRLDEPASGIQSLLSPMYLDSDLARTAIFSVRNSLKHVPASSLSKVLIPVFPPENSKRLLKITVMKELVRLVCQHISHKEHQTFLMTLWRRELHQDVRIDLIQSVIPFLGSKQEDLAWTILRDAVSNPALTLDDALFALLAVRPSLVFTDDSDVREENIIEPEILIDMAQCTIPSSCHDLYAESVLYPLSQLCPDIPETFPDLSQKEIRVLRERMHLLQRSAYHVIFSDFLKDSNARVFAQRGFDAARSVAFSNVQGVDLFPYFVCGIGRCITLDPQCWQILCQLVDFLANAVGGPKKEPTQTSLKAVQRLRAINLSSNMTFQRPESLRVQLSVDRMTLLEPLTKYGCDHFSVVFWERRFHLFSCERRRASSKVLSSELQEVQSLLLDLIQLSEALQYDLAQLKSKVVLLVNIASVPVADRLVDDLLSGCHGLDGIWINELRLALLTDRVTSTIDYGRSLSTFLTQISSYDKLFCVRHWTAINELILSTLKGTPEQKVPKNLVAIMLDPMFERAESSAWDLHCLDILLAKIPDVIINHRPQWALERVSTKLSSLQPWETTPSSLWPVVQFVKSVNATRVLARYNDDSCSDLSPLTALLVEAIYSGNLRGFNLERVITSAQQTDPVLLYPYFVTDQDDGSGGDIENRRSKATVPQLLDRYQEWKTTHASQYLSGIHPPQAFPSVLILQEIFEYFPQLALVNPSLFLSYATVTFGQSVLDTNTKIHRVISLLKRVLKPDRRWERGTQWGWAPPLSLTLSFARILFTETADEVAETVLDEHASVGSHTCKLGAMELLQWWAETFYGAGGGDLGQLVKTMERGEGKEALVREFGELKTLACGDECRAVREKAFILPFID